MAPKSPTMAIWWVASYYYYIYIRRWSLYILCIVVQNCMGKAVRTNNGSYYSIFSSRSSHSVRSRRKRRWAGKNIAEKNTVLCISIGIIAHSTSHYGLVCAHCANIEPVQTHDSRIHTGPFAHIFFGLWESGIGWSGNINPKIVNQ